MQKAGDVNCINFFSALPVFNNAFQKRSSHVRNKLRMRNRILTQSLSLFFILVYFQYNHFEEFFILQKLGQFETKNLQHKF